MLSLRKHPELLSALPVYPCTTACSSHAFSLVCAEKPRAVHRRGTAQKLLHWAAGAERTFWHCSISGADWWLQVSRAHPLPFLPTSLPPLAGLYPSVIDRRSSPTQSLQSMTRAQSSPVCDCVRTVQYKAFNNVCTHVHTPIQYIFAPALLCASLWILTTYWHGRAGLYKWSVWDL